MKGANLSFAEMSGIQWKQHVMPMFLRNVLLDMLQLRTLKLWKSEITIQMYYKVSTQ